MPLEQFIARIKARRNPARMWRNSPCARRVGPSILLTCSAGWTGLASGHRAQPKGVAIRVQIEPTHMARGGKFRGRMRVFALSSQKRENVIVPRRFQPNNAPAPAKDGPRVNEEIISRTILLIGDDGHKYGEIGSTRRAPSRRNKASTWSKSRPTVKPPVVKLMDYGKYKYEQQKKAAEARKKQKVIEIKEIKMRPTIDDHDYDVKMRAMQALLRRRRQGQGDAAFPRPRNGAPASRHGAAQPDPEGHRRHRQDRTIPEDGRPPDDDGAGAAMRSRVNPTRVMARACGPLS